MHAETLKGTMNYSRGVQRGRWVAVEVGRVVKKRKKEKKMEHRKEDNGGGGRVGVRENDIVIHPTLCRKLRLKDAKLQAHTVSRG